MPLKRLVLNDLTITSTTTKKIKPVSFVKQIWGKNVLLGTHTHTHTHTHKHTHTMMMMTCNFFE